eukprot:m.191574 g.191574  ORF g.191574 m.191574 type:complete len:375 (-) comp14845_c0_seq2:2066-3190(-)
MAIVSNSLVFVIVTSTAVGAGLFLWFGSVLCGVVGGLGTLGMLAFVAANMILRPPFRIYQGPAHDRLTNGITGHAKRLWKDTMVDPTEHFDIAFESVSVPIYHGNTKIDSEALSGWYIPARSRTHAHSNLCVVLVHGAARDRRAFLRHLPAFHSQGYAALMCDLRAHGLSSGGAAPLTYGPRESLDVESMVRYARGVLGHSKIVVCGTSTGAAAALIASGRVQDTAALSYIDGVVAENSFACRADQFDHVAKAVFMCAPWLAHVVAPFHWLVRELTLALVQRLDTIPYVSPRESVGRVAPRPVLLMHGTSDLVVPVEHSLQLYDAASEPKQLWVVEGAEHTALYDVDAREWEARVQHILHATQPGVDHTPPQPL